MFIQLFRNRIRESRLLTGKLQRIELTVKSNLSKNETYIVSKIVNEWNSQRIDLSQLSLNGVNYDLWLLHFHTRRDHLLL